VAKFDKFRVKFTATHRGSTDEIPRFIAATQVKFRSLIKSWIDKSNTCYELNQKST